MKSPYLENTNRLADVIAAIQVLGTYKYYKLPVGGWAKRITGLENETGHWKSVFEQHPEFFRFDNTSTKVSLVWRRSYKRNFDVDSDNILSNQELESLKTTEKGMARLKDRISRQPLSNSDIGVLVDTSIKIHSRALEHKKKLDWWKPAVFGLIGIIIGALIKAFSSYL